MTHEDDDIEYELVSKTEMKREPCVIFPLQNGQIFR